MSAQAAASKVTTDPNEIREWVTARGGRPARVKNTGSKDPELDPGLLRIDFGKPDPNLEPISWEEFFEKMEENDLAFLYQDKTADGKESRFFKFVKREK
jgi:hypothetical protein